VGASQIVMGTDHPIPWHDKAVDHILNTPSLSVVERAAILGDLPRRRNRPDRGRLGGRPGGRPSDGPSASDPPGLHSGVDPLLRGLDLELHRLTSWDRHHIMWRAGRACSNYRLEGILDVREGGMDTASARLAIGAPSKRR
jgi:hypothetical protein